MSKTNSPVVFVDLDNTLVNYLHHKASTLKRAFPEDSLASLLDMCVAPDDLPSKYQAVHAFASRAPGWWRGIPDLPGKDNILSAVASATESLTGESIHVLTKASMNKPLCWSEKVEWFNTNVRSEYPESKITISTDKSLLRGDVLFDDWPGYYEPWLEANPCGTVFCPEWPWNNSSEDPRVIKYDPFDNVPFGFTFDSSRRWNNLYSLLVKAVTPLPSI